MSPLHIAVVGAGPVGLALALLAARRLPDARVTVFDARALDRDVAADPRTLALSLGSVQLLQQLGAWPGDAAAPIHRVHVSQAPAGITLPGLLAHDAAAVTLDASELGVPQLGAVLAYGQLLAPLQAAWLAAAAAEPQRLATRFGTPVAALKPLVEGGDGVEVDAGIAERFDLAVVAEGGVFADQARKALVADYGQTAWVGTATLAAASGGVAFERFTTDGPLALLPLPDAAAQPPRAALVWCVPTATDPVAPLADAQRLALLNSRLPAEAGAVTALSPLKCFALGLNAERSLVQGRTVRIGNAAQTLHPVAGQGLSLGLRDAHALVDALQRGPAVDAALARVAWSRAPDRWSLIAATDFLARSFTWRLPGAAALRGLGLAVFAEPRLRVRQCGPGRRSGHEHFEWR